MPPYSSQRGVVRFWLRRWLGIKILMGLRMALGHSPVAFGDLATLFAFQGSAAPALRLRSRLHHIKPIAIVTHSRSSISPHTATRHTQLYPESDLPHLAHQWPSGRTYRKYAPSREHYHTACQGCHRGRALSEF